MGRHRPAPHRRPAVELLPGRTGRRTPWLTPTALAAGGVLACAAAVVVGTAVDDRPPVTGLTRAGSITAAPVPAPGPQEVDEAQAAPAAPRSTEPPTTEPPAAPSAPARQQIDAEPGPAPVDRAPDRVVRQPPSAPPTVAAPAPVDPAPVLAPVFPAPVLPAPVLALPLPEPPPSTQPRPYVPPPAVPVDDDATASPAGSRDEGDDPHDEQRDTDLQSSSEHTRGDDGDDADRHTDREDDRDTPDDDGA